jgi:hypothetical protein
MMAPDAASCRLVRSSLHHQIASEMDERIAVVRGAAAGVAAVRMRKEVSRVRDRDSTTPVRTIAARVKCVRIVVASRNRRRRPLKLNLTCRPWSYKKKKGESERCAEYIRRAVP